MMNKSILLLQMCLLIITTRQVSGEETLQLQKCDLDRHYWCGDVCTGDWLACSCGNVTLSKYSSYYCCIDPGDTCTYDYIDGGGDAVNPVCSRGRPVPRSQTCLEDTPSTEAEGQITLDYTSKCPYGDQHFMCGNICTHSDSSCMCGSTNLTYWHTQHYCCLASDDHCTTGVKMTVCSNGKAVHKSEPCHGVCNEDSQDTKTDGESCGYTDQCDFRYGSHMCGDICTHEPCTCGAATLTRLWYKDSPDYCCTSHNDHCSYEYDEYGNIVNLDCVNGTLINKAYECYGQCFNSYQHSRNYGYERYEAPTTAYYSCPEGRCVPVCSRVEGELLDRCRGVEAGICSKTTGDCDDRLVCRDSYDGGATRHHLTSPGVQGHHYCSYYTWMNTGEYENIDRSDENITTTRTSTHTRLAALLQNCTTDYGTPGYYCGNVCMPIYEWCSNWFESLCVEVVGKKNETLSFQSNDPELCSDNLFWQTQGCNWSWSTGAYGIRCNGTIQRCILPWYTQAPGAWFGDRWDEEDQTCEDHSAQVWPLHSACPNSSHYFHKLKSYFPQGDFSDVNRQYHQLHS